MDLYLLTDYRGQFYSSTKYRGAGVDLLKLKDYFSKRGVNLIVVAYKDIDFRIQNYNGKWVLYQSSEDPGLFYRSYIEDIVLGLLRQGAKLIPNYFYFRAHHNKNFLEILRDQSTGDISIGNIKSSLFGTYEDYIKESAKFKDGSYVIKSADTSKSRGVALLSSLKDKIKIPKKFSKSFSLQNLSYFFETLRTGKQTSPISDYRKKFIVQTYIEFLKGDYRVVIYGQKYYVLYRENRPKDFRASGSMLFDYEVDLPPELLDYSRRILDYFNVPFIALDIGFANNQPYLFEFQFLSFGQYTLEKSKFFYRHNGKGWEKKTETPDLEREIVDSVSDFIKRQE